MKDVNWVDLGPWPPALAITTSRRGYQNFMKWHCGGKAADHQPFPGPRAGLCQKLEKKDACRFIIAIGPHQSRDELAATLAHEATHAMRWILEYVGEKEPGTETECYLVEHIVKSGLDAIPAK